MVRSPNGHQNGHNGHKNGAIKLTQNYGSSKLDQAKLTPSPEEGITRFGCESDYKEDFNGANILMVGRLSFPSFISFS